jgi:cyclophilin family peptidyl-prolyl cis-trans isomerase
MMLMSILTTALLMQAAPPPSAPTPQPTPAPDGPVVVLTTSMGRIKIALYQGLAPISTENFLRYAREGFFDGTVFHRVIPGFMIQGGGFTADMKEKATRAPIRNEARNGLRNSRGTVAMARTSAPNSATAQFYISVKNNHSLDFGISGAGYAVFGLVVEGMDVVDRISAVPTGTRAGHDDVPHVPVVIQSAREEKAAGKAAAPPAAAPKARSTGKP